MVIAIDRLVCGYFWGLLEIAGGSFKKDKLLLM